MLNTDSQFEFTKCVLSEGDNTEQVVTEGQWFTIKCKRLFDSACFKTLFEYPNLDLIIGFKTEKDSFTNVRLRLGYFNSQISFILHKAICQMRLNELARISFELDPELLDESFKNDKNKADLNKKVYLDINFEINLIEIENFDNMLEFIDQRRIYDLNEYQLFKISVEHKKDANELYRNNLIRTAFQRYHKAISFLIISEQIVNEKDYNAKKDISLNTISEESSIENYNHDLKIEILELKSNLYSNLAACQIKSRNYSMVLINCTKCLELDQQKNVKALFRRAQAYTYLNDWEEAITDLKLAISIDSTNEELKQHLTKVETLKKKFNQAFSSNLKNYFN